MSLTRRPTRRDWFYHVVAAYTGLHLVWLAFLTADFVIRPLAPDSFSQTIAFRWLLALGAMPITLTVALLVLRRAPGNIIGFCLLLLCALIMSVALRDGSPLRTYDTALNSSWTGLWLLGMFFPDGQPQPARLGGFIRLLCALSLVSNAALSFFAPEFTLGDGASVANPLFLEPLRGMHAAAYGVQQGLLLTVAVLLLPSVIWRYRISDPRSRLQLKWLGMAYALLLILTLPLWILTLAAGGTDPFDSLGRLPALMVTFYILVFPTLAVGVAILRHKLYDIDVVIRRTLIYSVLSAVLALAYFGSVLVLENLFRALTGQGQNALVTVLSTLGIAALFGPLRARVQRGIDQRFYRKKYDAARILANFGAQARDVVEIEQLTSQLLAAVHQSMQPAHAALWLARPGRPHHATPEPHRSQP